MSCAMMPSKVMIGKIVDFFPIMKHFLCTHLAPLQDHPICLLHRCSLIFVCLITKYQHFQVRHKICDVIHVNHTQAIIALQSLAQNVLVSELELLKSAK
jgi:hypothetical protein